MVCEEVNKCLICCRVSDSIVAAVQRDLVPFNRPLISLNFPASSSFRKSFVFWAKSLRCTVESRWYVIISEAVVSRFVTIEVRSMSGVRLVNHNINAIVDDGVLLQAEMAFWNLFSPSSPTPARNASAAFESGRGFVGASRKLASEVSAMLGGEAVNGSA